MVSVDTKTPVAAFRSALSWDEVCLLLRRAVKATYWSCLVVVDLGRPCPGVLDTVPVA